jgi:hypothetical protein
LKIFRVGLGLVQGLVLGLVQGLVLGLVQGLGLVLGQVLKSFPKSHLHIRIKAQ